MEFRIEKDSLGEKKVPKHAKYGVQTQRSIEHFRISGRPFSHDMFYAMAALKIAATKANFELGLLSKEKTDLIVQVSKEILKGEHDDEFVIDEFQGGTGTPSHMNINEVIANRSIELMNEEKGKYHLMHPNDDVNMGQSTNDVVPNALRIVSV